MDRQKQAENESQPATQGGLVTGAVSSPAPAGRPAQRAEGSRTNGESAPAKQNRPQRPGPSVVPNPPTLPSGYPARGDLARALRVLATEGDELVSDPDAPRDEQAKARSERKDWARRVKAALERAALPHHATYCFETTERTLPSGNLLLSLGRALGGGDEEIKSGWRLEERLAKLRRIIPQLEESPSSQLEEPAPDYWRNRSGR